MNKSDTNSYFTKSREVVIKPRENIGKANFAELFAYRDLWLAMIARDVRIRYKQTVLGVGWAVIQPLVTMLIFTLIFGRLAKIPSDGVPYPVFVFSGNSMVGAANLITKVYFPRLIVPLSSMGVAFVDFLVACVILLIMMLLFGVGFSWQLILLPIWIVGLLTCATGMGTFLSSLTVTYRDFRFLIPFMIQLWMYLTPIVYPVSFIPEKWQWLMYLNPINGWIGGVRSAFLGQPLDLVAILFSFIWTVLLLFIGLRYFFKTERWFADVI